MTQDATRRLRFAVHSSGWLNSMADRCCRCVVVVGGAIVIMIL